MTLGIGGSTIDKELSQLTDMTQDIQEITTEEYASRIAKLQALMQENHLDIVYVNAGSSLYYFTGTRWYPSERMVGALIPAQGAVEYIAPAFEEGTLEIAMHITGKVNTWQEHESPHALFWQTAQRLAPSASRIGVDESCDLCLYDGLVQANTLNATLQTAKTVISACRMHKSAHEIALMQRANDMTIEVQKAAARILHVGISVTTVTEFIHKAHQRVGSPSGSVFCIVLFGEDTQYPHGVSHPQTLQENAAVLIDTGCRVQGYCSDITRSYVYGQPSERYRTIWQHEKDIQASAYAAATLGASCESVDAAARRTLEAQGYASHYRLPGLPHRTGHGTGLDIHEYPYIVKGNTTPLAQGMCCSNEPMLCIPNEFGIRHEDHFYMTETGPQWFSQPAYSVDDPFGYERV